jgi:hypothetical protein
MKKAAQKAAFLLSTRDKKSISRKEVTASPQSPVPKYINAVFSHREHDGQRNDGSNQDDYSETLDIGFGLFGQFHG